MWHTSDTIKAQNTNQHTVAENHSINEQFLKFQKLLLYFFFKNILILQLIFFKIFGRRNKKK